MLIIGKGYNLRDYKSEKNEKYNKYLEKARQMRNAVDQTSLKDKDKTTLKNKMAKILMGE